MKRWKLVILLIEKFASPVWILALVPRLKKKRSDGYGEFCNIMVRIVMDGGRIEQRNLSRLSQP